MRQMEHDGEILCYFKPKHVHVV